jgi:hypothetical protein
MTVMSISDHVRTGIEPVAVYDAENDLDGYALFVAPEWWAALVRKGHFFEDRQIQRLEDEMRDKRPLSPIRCTYSSAWADAEQVRYVPGVGFRWFPPVEP